MTAQELGRAGEAYAAEVLEQSGLRVVARNFRCSGGEVDVIAVNVSYLVFAEVKTRTVGGLGEPSQAVTPQKQRRIIGAALAYLERYPSDLQPRFDVLEVTASKNGEILSCNHLENAFGEF